mmetsp:Transcript_46370/g.110422  ORF Transcript_46370/g.110422 Transcript_46370/m.110422 type:complete len:498 (+) Transcript_46370:146-1639(+)
MAAAATMLPQQGSAEASLRSLSKSQSEPGGGSLGAAGSYMMSGETTTSYEQSKALKKFKDWFPQIRPAGVSTVLPLADSAGRDLQQEIYYPLPGTPGKEQKFRRLSQPVGVVHVHPGLKDQVLPESGFVYGIRGTKGVTAEMALKKGLKMGIDAYKNSVAERVYESNKKEPLGKPYIRGHTIKMLPEGFGNKSGVPEDMKMVCQFSEGKDTPESRAMYKMTHNSFDPAEQFKRNYLWPGETQGEHFRFGLDQGSTKEGEGVRMVMNMNVEDDNTFKRTRLVQKVAEDFRHVERPKVAEQRHAKQGPSGPPVPLGHAFGIKSGKSDYTAESCIRGFYSLPEQLPDPDLGKSLKIGRRNFTSSDRAFGIPSIRTDVPAPDPLRRSLANMHSYGDEPGAPALLNPQRFETKGVPDQEFLLRRPKSELMKLLQACGEHFSDHDVNAIFDQAAALFDDGRPLVSLDAFLYVYSNEIDERVKQRVAGRALLASASAPTLTRTS